ncbi:CG17717, partial [Drosophila busckii]
EQQPAQQLNEFTALRLYNSVVGSNNALLTAVPVDPLATTTENTSSSNNSNSSDNSNNTNCSSTHVETADESELPASFRLPLALPGHASQESIHSANEFGNFCRICRWNRSDMELITCPCKCKGSVGHIHLKCLKRWIMHRRENRCEICNAPFNITSDRASLKQMVRAFCCGRCCGMIVKHVLFSASLMPLAHVILQQVLHCMDNLNQGSTEQLTVQEVFVASCALLTSSALFFHFFEFVTTRFLLIRNILRHWWMFGSTNDFGLVEVEDDTFDLF